MQNSSKKPALNGTIDETFGDQSSDFFEKIVAVAPSILYVFDLSEMRNVWVNRSMFVELGYSAEEVGGLGNRLLQTLMHPDDFERYPAHFEILRTLSPGEKVRFEYRMMAKDGTWHWLSSEEMAFGFDEEGKVTQIVGSAHDISQARMREDRIKLLVREMNHRIKNLFAVIQSMISLTAKTKRNAPVSEAFETIKGRVNALATAQSLSMPEANEKLTSSRELVDLILKPYAISNSIEISGQEALLNSDQSNSLAMILHELATNAIKYGSLSTDDGHLSIKMDVETEAQSNKLVMTWTEDATFELTDLGSNLGTGFGSRLISRSTEQMGGSLEMDWRSSGLVAKLKIPLQQQG